MVTMSQLNLTFVSDGIKTRSMIGLKQNVNQILVTNGDAKRTLRVVFAPAGNIEIRGGDTLPGGLLELGPSGSQLLRFKGDPNIGDHVSYTAQLSGTLPEDPIIIID